MWLSILLKEPVCKQFFVAFRFVIYKIVSFKGNSSLAPALEIVGGTEVFFSFRFDVLVLMFPRTRISVMAKTNFKMVHYNQKKKIDSPLRTRNPQVELKKDPTHMVLWTKFFKVLDKEDQGSN